ncbi:hypothetical protein [Nocardia bovistercoris]|uniref:Uncharacterized protein n=1 Tax=Nocardia bovistercoris TaxID=2785916 RepID=A0A931N101_9NOCA|nr:hypothetical protein [Nocardia bovistercoris]MBH0777845.1 hypothetical protein [Nocardia bovistercoris]
MRIPHALAALVSAITLSGVLTVTGIAPAGAAPIEDGVAPAGAAPTEEVPLADAPITDAAGLCVGAAPTFDDVATAAATAIRAIVPADRVTDYDGQVDRFRVSMSTMRVHRDALPVDPGTVNENTASLDDPIVTYLVNGLDAVHTGRIDQTMSISRLTVNDVIEVLVLATGVVKIPAQLAASMVPMVGFVLKPVVSELFTGVKALARTVQGNLVDRCASPNAYRPLEVDQVTVEPVEVPAAIRQLASNVVRGYGSCTPVANLTTGNLLQRTTDFLDRPELPINRVALRASADSMQSFLRENRVMARRTQDSGGPADLIGYGPLAFASSLGFGIHQTAGAGTVPLAEMPVADAMELATFTLDAANMLLSAGAGVAEFVGVDAPLSIAQTLMFAPVTYGMPIVKGVIQSMCAK